MTTRKPIIRYPTAGFYIGMYTERLTAWYRVAGTSRTVEVDDVLSLQLNADGDPVRFETADAIYVWVPQS